MLFLRVTEALKLLKERVPIRGKARGNYDAAKAHTAFSCYYCQCTCSMIHMSNCVVYTHREALMYPTPTVAMHTNAYHSGEDDRIVHRMHLCA